MLLSIVRVVHSHYQVIALLPVATEYKMVYAQCFLTTNSKLHVVVAPPQPTVACFVLLSIFII